MQATVKQRVLKLLKALEYGPVEWHGTRIGFRRCPVCGGVSYVQGMPEMCNQRHDRKCELRMLIKELEDG